MVHNFRSVFPDIHIYPLKNSNFLLTTAVELINNDKENKKKRFLEWNDESVYNRIQMKVRKANKLY